VTPKQEGWLEELARQLQAAHRGDQPLSQSVLRHARALVRLVDAGGMPLTELHERRVDNLYGLLRWGELAYPLHRLAPGLFAQERRARRSGGTGPHTPEWSD
jgi:hypothetical protein